MKNYCRAASLSIASRTSTTACKRSVTPTDWSNVLVLADLETKDMCAAVGKLKKNPTTQHLPVLAFGGDSKPELQAEVQKAGATLLVSDAAVLNHLPECLEQVLRIE